MKITLLKKMLKEEKLGVWSIDEKTIQFLWNNLMRDRPQFIIECGSGISSLVLATYSKFLSTKLSYFPQVFSIEQDVHIKEKIEKKLKKFDLIDFIKILYAPISEQGKYRLNGNDFPKKIGQEKADWILIDGPSGPPSDCRLWVLPTLAPFCRPGTKWFLDDAFRNAELNILNKWRYWGVIVKGIYPIGKGLGFGLIKDPQRILKF